MSNSGYYETLTGDVKCRYDQKIGIINNIDPYKLSPGDCTLNIRDLPNVTIVDLVYYLSFTRSFYTGEQMKAIKSLQAYKFAKTGAVLSLLAKKINEESYVIVCKVRHSQRFREKPLDTWIILMKTGSISSAHCTCMAGLGEVCSHIATILFFLHFRPSTEEESTLSCTERLAAWPVPAIKTVSMVTVNEMDWSQKQHVGPLAGPSQVRNICMNNEGTETFLRKLIKGGASPAICRLIDPFASEMEKKQHEKEPKDLPDTYESWYNEDLSEKTYEDLLRISKNMNMTLTEKQIDNIEAYTKNQSQNNVWFKYRAGRITASKFKSVCKTSVENPSLTVIKGPQKVIFYSKQTSYGMKHEKTAVKNYEDMVKPQHENLVVKSTGFFEVKLLFARY